MSKVYKKLGIFGVLQLLDYITTMLNVRVGSIEANKIANYFIQKDNLHMFKIIGLIIVCFICINAGKRNPDRVSKFLNVVNVLYLLIILNNTFVYFLMTKIL